MSVARDRALAAFRVRTYRWWFGSSVFAASGSMILSVAMSWVVLGLTGRAVDLGILTAATWGPVLVCGGWGGVLADRFDRRRVLIATHVVFAALSMVLAALVLASAVRLWMLLALALLLGVGVAIDG